MDTSLTQATTKLAKGEILRVNRALGQSIAVVRGMVWITQEGDRRDTFLTDGESFVFDQRGTALAQAISDTSLLAFVGEAAEVIEAEPAPTADAAGHRAVTASIRLHQQLAAQFARVPAHQMA
ncbi:MAG TPA: DUF2917 domain-containing protein [Burkholderiaceae bacterium]|nr:DUF2917 domain-containing protein [Burkholderiaceae bacterium]